jgi:serine/threonine protein phosphatase PrpC
MRILSALAAAGHSHPGHYRDVNEDRYHVDVQRGVFIVVDGVGGQAAGGKAADTAIASLRTRLERETGAIADRIREAITTANNEICRLASLRAEWAGMACVLTVAIVDDDRAVIGHVGDTRLYKIRNANIEKVTRDHSPVGEREDAGEISEFEAMRHSRRHEVYRDVGSDPHDPLDADFIDVLEIPFEADAALLICSDGLTDLVPSSTICEIVTRLAGSPEMVAGALVAAANDAGGRDNVTVVYVEGERFCSDRTRQLSSRSLSSERVSENQWSQVRQGPETATAPERRRRLWVRVATILLLVALFAAVAARASIRWPRVDVRGFIENALGRTTIVVRPSDSIAAALSRAEAGATVLVEPGEYRERVRLKDGVRLVSREPRGATLRLPSNASEGDPAVVADGISGAELAGFRILGDAGTPLGTGVAIRNAAVTLVDVEIAGAARVAVDIAGMSGGTILGVDIHDNPGAAMRVRTGATTRIAHSSFVRNGAAAGDATWLLVETGAAPHFSRNVFHGIVPAAFVTLDESARALVARENWFIEHAPAAGQGSAPVRPAVHGATRAGRQR